MDQGGLDAVGSFPRRRAGARLCAGRAGGSRGRLRGAAAVLLTAAVASVLGCHEGIRWQALTYLDAQVRSRAENKPIFVYFFEWASVDCTHFDQEVLSKPEVLAETRSLVCVPLLSHWDVALMTQLGLDRIPAFAIVAPTGEVLSRGQGPITLNELLDALRGAKAKFAAATPGTTAPAPAPTKPP